MEREEIKQWFDKIIAYEGDECPESPTDFFTHSIVLFNNASILSGYALPIIKDFIESIVSQYRVVVIWNFGRDTYRVPLEIKVELIDSIFFLFRDYFSSFKKRTEPLTFIFMFWDGLFYDTFHDKDKLSQEMKIIEDRIFSCLCKILTLDSELCQYSALHGFNHLRDDRCKSIIDEFIAGCKDKELIEFANRAKNYEEL